MQSTTTCYTSSTVILVDANYSGGQISYYRYIIIHTLTHKDDNSQEAKIIDAVNKDTMLKNAQFCTSLCV